MAKTSSESQSKGSYLYSFEEHVHAPQVFQNNSISYNINAHAYFQSLVEDIERLGRNKHHADLEFLYIAGFVLNWLQPGYPLLVHGRNGSVRFFDLILEKARAGVDVRFLAWIPWNLAMAGKLDMRPESGDNMRTVAALRQEPAMAKKACLNIIAHPAGCTHLKLVVLGGNGWAAGYTGGIDLSPDRLESHWLDVQARAEGPVVQAMYDLYRDLWNQNLVFAEPNGYHRSNGNGHNGKFNAGRLAIFKAKRPVFFKGRGGAVQSVVAGTQPVPVRALPGDKCGEHRVQSLLTVPQFKFAFNPLLAPLRVAPLDIAPKGVYQVCEALKHAISSAQRYVYIEDQYFWSSEVMQWLNTALRNRPEVRLILATGESDQLGDRLEAYRRRAVIGALLPGLTEAERRRITYIKWKDMIHAKTILVDDHWALIGSANIARRSLYTDIEHALAFVDPQGLLVRDYRIDLWASRLGIAAQQRSQLLDPERCASLWNAGWGAALPEVSVARSFQACYESLPTIPTIDEEWYEMVDDPDVRQPWYFPLRRKYDHLIPKQST